MLRSHRFALAAAAVVFGLSSCGDAPRTATSGQSPVVIHLGQPSTSANAETAAADKMMVPYMIMNFVYDGALPDLGATGQAWKLPAGTQIDADRVARMAALLGVSGEVRELPADQGGGWMVGAADYTSANLSVSADGLLSWWFNPDPSVYGDGTAVTCSDPGVMVDPAVSEEAAPAPSTPVTEVPTTDVPVCETPQPPEGVPDSETALANAQQLMRDLGYDPAGYEFETYADEWGANVTAYLMIEGHRSPLTVSVGYGAQGALTWASGTMATPESAGEYPLVSVQAGIDRMNAEGGYWMGYYGPAGAMVKSAVNETVTAGEATPPADTAVAGSAVVEPIGTAPYCDPAADCYDGSVPEPEEITVHLNSAKVDLTMVWDVDGTVWLVPAYTFSDVDGGSYTVIAVDEEFVTLPDPGLMPEPVPVETGSGSEGSEGSVAADIDTAISALVGVAEDEAAKLAEGYGWTFRVIERDGESLPATMDFNPARVNVTVEAGVVVTVQSFG